MPAQSPRVLMVSGESPPVIGGVADFSWNLLRAMKAERPSGSFRLLSRRPRWFYPFLTRKDGITVIRPVFGWTESQIPFAIRLAQWLRYDILHIQEESFSFFESDAALKLAELKPDVPVIVTLHEVHHERSSFEITRRLLARADVIVANDTRTADRCKTYAGRKVDSVFFSPSNIEPLPERDRPEKIAGNVTTFGLINPLKRFDVLFEALKKVRRSYPGLTWTIIGPFEPATDTDHRRVYDLMGGESWIRFTGALEARRTLPYELHKSEILLLPFDDGASLRRTSLHVGWRFGLPIITTRPQADENSLVEGRNVMFADKDDPESWSDRILEILSDGELRKSLKENGLETSKSFTFKNQAQDYLALYDRLVR